jgi:hypothetical protein
VVTSGLSAVPDEPDPQTVQQEEIIARANVSKVRRRIGIFSRAPWRFFWFIRLGRGPLRPAVPAASRRLKDLRHRQAIDVENRTSWRPARDQRVAPQPFSLNPTGTLSRRHLAHFYSAVDSVLVRPNVPAAPAAMAGDAARARDVALRRCRCPQSRHRRAEPMGRFGLALPKSVESGNLSFSKTGIRWMLANQC